MVDVRSEPPLAIRSAGDRVLVVGSAAAPVGGDDLALDVVVGPGASLSLGTVAATMAWPGPTGGLSRQRVRATVAERGHLCWTPEPLVLVARCRHRSSTEIDVAAGATAWIADEIALGRAGQQPGALETSWRVTRAGRPLVHHAEQLGPGVPGWGSAVTVAHHRHVLAAVAVGVPVPVHPPVVERDAAAAVLAVAPDAFVVLASGVDRVAVQRVCATVLSCRTGPIGPVLQDSSGQAGRRTS
jgi:urease accessory protein